MPWMKEMSNLYAHSANIEVYTASKPIATRFAASHASGHGFRETDSLERVWLA